MTRSPARMAGSRLIFAGVIAVTLAAGMAAAPRAAQAQEPWHHRGAGVRGGVSVGGAVALSLLGAALWLDIHGSEPPPPPPCCYAPPPPPCCYTPPPPPPVMLLAPPPAMPPPPNPVRLGLAVSGLVQSAGAASGQSPIAGVAAALQMRTSPHSLFALEVQSLTSDRAPAGNQRDEIAGLMAGRLYPWDAPFAPYVELAGGIGRVAIDSDTFAVHTSQLIGRAGIGIELRLGPHLVLDGQAAQVHRFRFDGDGMNTLAANDPAFIGEHERLNELRLGLGYRF